MRLSRLSFAWLILSLPLVQSYTSQISLESIPPSIESSTLIDALSADPDYTSLLKLLQKSLLVPTLNRLNGSTLFAPTNDAIGKNPSWVEALSSTGDNIHQKLRQELLYHLLNYSITVSSDGHELQVHKTLHFPQNQELPPPRLPPSNPPWFPRPGGLLGGEAQRVRIASQSGSIMVGVNAFGQGGVHVVKGQVDAGNGMLFGIGGTLDVPPDLATVISRQSSLSYFNSITTMDIMSKLNSTPELTLFLPVDSAWDSLPEIERIYLESQYATDDLLNILHTHAVATEGVHWSESFKPRLNLTTLSGSALEIVVSSESQTTHISSAELVESDIYAANGVLHTVSSFLMPFGAFNITPEKYLLALNCSSFVSMLHSANLTSLINNTEPQYTILAPTNEVLELYGLGGDKLPEQGGDGLQRLLRYHFIPGKWTSKKLKDGMLLETALEESGLGGGHQVLHVEVTGKNDKDDKKIIRFGGASVMGEAYETNSTTIYLISRPLVLPLDALETALPFLELSSFIAAVFSTSLARHLKGEPRTTFLIPENDGFKRLGVLVSAHLLSASAKSDLESVILHHVLDNVVYAQSLQNGSQRSYATLEGSDVHVDRSENHAVSIAASGGWAGMSSKVSAKNMLTKTGVIHGLSDVLLPRSLNLTIGKLVKAASGTAMTSMLVRAGMDWILNGTKAPEGSPWSEVDAYVMGWTLLCPTDEAFKGYNLTELFSNPEFLKSVVEQHLIPISKPYALKHQQDPFQVNAPIQLADSAMYTTLHSRNSAYGDIVFRQAGSDEKGVTGYVVGIKDARGTEGQENWAQVLSWGRMTVGGGVGGVIQIDTVLLPYRPSRWLEYSGPIAVTIMGMILIGSFFLGVRIIWLRDTSEATFEPVGGFSNEDDEDN